MSYTWLLSRYGCITTCMDLNISNYNPIQYIQMVEQVHEVVKNQYICNIQNSKR